MIFGDGAGALCLEGVETDRTCGVLASVLHSQGEFAGSLMTEAPASRLNPRLSETMLQEGRHYPTMDGRSVFKHAVRRLPQVAQEVLGKAGLTMNDIDLFIPHQANLRINQAFQKAMNLPDEKIFNNIQRYGNTTAASIPIAFDEAIEKGLLKTGSTVMFLGLGAGLTWGAAIYRFA